MARKSDDGERRREDRYERLGTDSPMCALCPEDDPRCLERHHVAGRKFADLTIILCQNDHSRASDMQRDHPAQEFDPPHVLESIAHFLLGVADLLEIAGLLSTVAPSLREFAGDLLELARRDAAQPHNDTL